MSGSTPSAQERIWWYRRPYDRVELLADAIVHVIGLLIAVAAGAALLVVAAVNTAPEAVPGLAVYVGTFVAVMGVSMAFNLWPVTPTKGHLARLDQAAIFMFTAGTYTPLLMTIKGSPLTLAVSIVIWVVCLTGAVLKLAVPHRFGRVAILLYLAVGWSGLLLLGDLARSLPPSAPWLLLGGGVVYSLGVIFHLWERLRFQNALWHVAVVIGASLHMAAILDCMVLSRLGSAA